MKKVLFIVLMAVVAIACDKDEIEVFHIDPNSKVYVKQAGLTKSASSEGHLSALEIVKKSNYLTFYNYGFSQSPMFASWPGKDTVSAEPAFIRVAAEIIYDTTGYGDYGVQHDFIDGVDFVISSGPNPYNLDTLAYIPNANIKSAKEAIYEALAERDTLAVYDIFQNAFKFIPITGAEWRELKRQGLN